MVATRVGFRELVRLENKFCCHDLLANSCDRVTLQRLWFVQRIT